ncbi:conserved Plasmodium protein, unknown function [Plasmodium sp. DRC-Itaito]|nr:conserved Plasmodium protein, unknown function [Plasmodium sp. DRC-Itaito]
MIYLCKRLLRCTLFVSFLYIHFFRLKENIFCHVKVRHRILESINKDLSSEGDNLHIYQKRNVNVETFIKKKEKKNLSDNNINDKINNNNIIGETKYYRTTNEKKESIFLKFFRSIKNLFTLKSSNNLKKTNIKYEHIYEDNEFSKYILENNISIETTKVCLIGSGVDDTTDGLIKKFLLLNDKVNYNMNDKHDNSLSDKINSIISSFKYYSEEIIQEPNEIKKQICNKKKNCKESNLNYENNHDILIGNIIIQGDIWKNEKIINMNRQFVVCKSFGINTQTNKKINKSTSIQHVIKSLDYCTMEGVQFIYISYNIYEENNKLIEIMKKLREIKIIIETPSKKIKNHMNKNNNNNKNNDIYQYERIPNDEGQKSYSSLNLNVEKIFSIFGLLYADHNRQNEKKNYIYDNEIKILNDKGNKKLNRKDISLFYFSYNTDIYEKVLSDIIDDDHVVVSATFFFNSLVLMHSINLNLSLEKLRRILNKSILKREELRHLSNKAYNLDFMNIFEDSAEERKRSYKIFYLELKNKENKKLLNDANIKYMYQDNIPVKYKVEEQHVKKETVVDEDIYKKKNKMINKNRNTHMEDEKDTYIKKKESDEYKTYPCKKKKQFLLNDMLNHKPYVSFLDMSYNEDMQKKNYNRYDDTSYIFDQDGYVKDITYEDNSYSDDNDIHIRKKRKISHDKQGNNDYHIYDESDNTFHSHLDNHKNDENANVYMDTQKDSETRFLYDPFAIIDNRDLDTLEALSELEKKKTNNFSSSYNENSSNIKRRRQGKKKKLKRVIMRSKYDKLVELERRRKGKKKKNISTKRRKIHKNKINNRRNKNRKNNRVEKRRNKQVDRNISSGGANAKISGTHGSPKIKYKR